MYHRDSRRNGVQSQLTTGVVEPLTVTERYALQYIRGPTSIAASEVRKHPRDTASIKALQDVRDAVKIHVWPSDGGNPHGHTCARQPAHTRNTHSG